MTTPRDADERQLNDKDLIKKIFRIYDSIHPNSISSMRWVMNRRMFDRLNATAQEFVGLGWALTVETPSLVQKWSWVEPLTILGLPVRVGEAGVAQYQPIQIEVRR